MIASSLFPVCGLALLVVFGLLAFLALVMHFLTVLFPERKESADPAVTVAISATVASIFPGTRVTRIQEES